MPIAVVDFQSDAVGGQMASVIRNDLQGSGLFRSIPPASFIQQNLDAAGQPRFPDWRQVGAAGLVVGSVAQVGGNIKVDFRLWDVIQSSQATGLSFTSQPSNWRRLSHIIADAIYKRVTGEEGYFDTRIAYVSETGPLTARVKRIAIMDQDGANQPLHHRRPHTCDHPALLADTAGNRLHGLRRGQVAAEGIPAERR